MSNVSLYENILPLINTHKDDKASCFKGNHIIYMDTDRHTLNHTLNIEDKTLTYYIIFSMYKGSAYELRMKNIKGLRNSTNEMIESNFRLGNSRETQIARYKKRIKLHINRN